MRIMIGSFAGKSLPVVGLISALSLSPLVSQAQEGVTKDEIKIGASYGHKSSIAHYTIPHNHAIDVYLAKVNKQGGVNGRKIKHVAFDDEYKPDVATENAKKLLDQEKVFAILGGSGTPTMRAVLALASQKGVPVLYPYTGGVPADPHYFTIRVSYAEEAEALVNFAVKNLKAKKFGVFYQDDTFGTTGKNAVAKTLAGHGLQISVEGKYDRVKLDIEKALETFMKEKPEVIYLQSLTAPSIKLLKDAYAKGYKPTVLSSSIVSTADFIKELGKDASNVYVSEVLPLVSDSSFPIVKNFLEDMKAAGKSEFSNTQGLEGYVAAVAFVEMVKKAGANLTRKSFIETIESTQGLDLGGVVLNYSKSKHTGLDKNFIVKITEGKGEIVSK